MSFTSVKSFLLVNLNKLFQLCVHAALILSLINLKCEVVLSKFRNLSWLNFTAWSLTFFHSVLLKFDFLQYKASCYLITSRLTPVSCFLLTNFLFFFLNSWPFPNPIFTFKDCYISAGASATLPVDFTHNFLCVFYSVRIKTSWNLYCIRFTWTHRQRCPPLLKCIKATRLRRPTWARISSGPLLQWLETMSCSSLIVLST